MNIIKYPDGSGYVKEEDFNREITFKINTYEDLWYLNQYVDVCNHNGYTPTIVIPNLIDAQADRRFNKNESSGLKLVCKFLNGMKARFKIFHPHNPEVVETLINNVEIIDNSGFIEIVLTKLAPVSNLLLMSSDAGGFKPLMKLCDKIGWQGETYSASKSRKYEESGSRLTQIVDRKDFGGKDILIIDDICIYGGTFKGLAKLLKERNCGKLYLAVSHMTVQTLGQDPVTNYFDKVFTTDSKFTEYYILKDTAKISYDSENIEHFEFNIDNPTNLEIIKMF